MPKISILNEADLRRLVPLDLAAVDCIEAAFKVLSGGAVVMPPILSMPIADHNGEVDVKTAYVPRARRLCDQNVSWVLRQSGTRPAQHLGFDGAVFGPDRNGAGIAAG